MLCIGACFHRICSVIDKGDLYFDQYKINFIKKKTFLRVADIIYNRYIASLTTRANRYLSFDQTLLNKYAKYTRECITEDKAQVNFCEWQINASLSNQNYRVVIIKGSILASLLSMQA